jgi:hypothetical protein
VKRYLSMVALAALALFALSAIVSSAAQAIERDPIWLVKGVAIALGTELKLLPVLETKTWILKTAKSEISCTAIHVEKGAISDLYVNNVAEIGDDTAEVTFLGCTGKMGTTNCGSVTGKGDAKGVVGPFTVTSHLVWGDGKVGLLAFNLFELPTAGVEFNFESCVAFNPIIATGSVNAIILIAGKQATSKQEALELEFDLPNPNIKPYELCELGKGCVLHTAELKASFHGATEKAEEIGTLTKVLLENNETYGWS